jgi:hypothetical protein
MFSFSSDGLVVPELLPEENPDLLKLVLGVEPDYEHHGGAFSNYKYSVSV